MRAMVRTAGADDPAERQALLVVDLQNAFCHERGSVVVRRGPLFGVEAVVARVRTALDRARAAGVPVVFTRQVFRPDGADRGRNFRRRLADAPTALSEGSWDAELLEGLAAEGDLVVDKCRYDAFLHTSLEVVLHGLGVTELVVCGVVTNVCVESTVRSAYMRDFAVTLLGDCCAGRTRRLHEISLEALAASEFAQVAELERGFRFSCAPPAAPAAGLGRPREER